MLSDAINDQLRTVLGPSGKRPAAIAERVKKTWELGDGWVKHVTVEVALGTREGSSVRGGGLGGLHDGALADAADRRQGHRRRRRGGGRPHAVSRCRCRRPAAAAGGVVDSAALGEFAEQVTGRDGVLASAARHGARPARPRQCRSAAPETSTDAELIDLVTAELGSDWPRLVAPAFDGRKAVLFDDRWASAREDLVEAVADGRGRDRRRLAAALGAVRGRRPRRRHAGQLVAGQGPGRGPQRPRVAVRPRRRRCGEPGQGPLQPTRSRW